MIKFLNIIISAAIFGLLFSSCGKYEDGPGISFRSKKARLVNTWRPDRVFDENGQERAADNDDLTIDIHNNGDYTAYNSSVSQTGKWSFINDFESVKFVYSETVLGTTIVNENAVVILRLTNTEWWIRQDDGSKIYYKGLD